MQKTNLILLLIAGSVLSSTLALAPAPKDYTIAYTFKNPDGSVFRIMKYYLRDNNKSRTDYFSPAQYNISASAEASTALSDSAKTKSRVSEDVKLQTENRTNIEPHTIEILRKDKGLAWTMDASSKSYSEVRLRQDSWEQTLKSVSFDRLPDFKKTGEIKLLNYPCDIYEIVQTVKEDKWSSIAYVAQGLNVVLKTELRQNGKLVQTMEATEFSTGQPAASLFEIPGGYRKSRSN